MKNFLRFATIVSALTGAVVAHAADPVFPKGARVGLAPPEGFSVSSEFLGFESDDKNVKFGVAEIPAEAFTTVDKAFKEGKPAANGAKVEPFKTSAGDAYITVESRKEGDVNFRNYSLITQGEKFTGYIIAQMREGAPKALSDEAIRKTLATTVLRAEVPIEEQLSLLPFKVSDLGGFKTVRTLALRASVLLTDGTEDTTLDGAPYMVIGTIQSAPNSPEDRARFSEQIARTIPGMSNARITSNEAMRIDGTPGFETRIEATTGKNDTPVTLVQWLRFGNGSALRIIASAKRDEWPQAFPRFRTVRDGIGPK